MIEMPVLGLMFVMGLRHGLDPDHVAVIDNIVFRSVNSNPRLALWTGTFFAIGHSVSVAGVAVSVAGMAGSFAMPAWSGQLVNAAVIAMLLIVGALNLRALLRRGATYTPVGWRTVLVPGRLRMSNHPAAVFAIGLIFGLVFDTATQAAAWGAAATVQGGVVAALAIAATFAAGMILADTLDSQIVGRLLRADNRSAFAVEGYRRAVGWLVVTLSIGTAALAIAAMAELDVSFSDEAGAIIGCSLAAIVIVSLAAGRWIGAVTDRR